MGQPSKEGAGPTGGGQPPGPAPAHLSLSLPSCAGREDHGAQGLAGRSSGVNSRASRFQTFPMIVRGVPAETRTQTPGSTRPVGHAQDDSGRSW